MKPPLGMLAHMNKVMPILSSVLVLIGFSDLVCGFLKLSILMPLLSGSQAVSTMEVSLNGLAYSKYLAEC